MLILFEVVTLEKEIANLQTISQNTHIRGLGWGSRAVMNCNQSAESHKATEFRGSLGIT